MGFISEQRVPQTLCTIDGGGWLTRPTAMDDGGRRNLPIVGRLINDLFEQYDPEDLSRAWMVGRFKAMLTHLAAGSQDDYTLGLALRASATTWTYVATFYRNDEWVAKLDISGTL
ncbi:hypothetical protein [Burkholderia cepacia]|uniref:hypothetical protein n=1 Tax=Burkholderia cepacia TaxID=292 RepID=UPI003EE18497